ncbi:MAG: DUF5681 domain-containing protein [Lentilitoribacter sp.]
MATHNFNSPRPTRKRLRPKTNVVQPTITDECSTPMKYQIGHGKPPKSTQFKKGQSGNKKGRPKGSRNTDTIVNDLLNKKMQIRENGKQRNISTREAMIVAQLQKALKGDLKALHFLLNNFNGAELDNENRERPMSDEEKKKIAQFFSKLDPSSKNGGNDDTA